MTTSSSDRDRCNRISPSAVLDDRLDGKELEWARDHLRRCESCRERVEDFREMLLRVGRLPKAPVAAGAMDQAYEAAIPERFRSESGLRSFPMGPPSDTRTGMPAPEPPMSMLPEVTSIPDLMSELEREIFHDEPAFDHPAPLTTPPPPLDAVDEPAVEEQEIEPVRASDHVDFVPPLDAAPEAEPEPEPVLRPEPPSEPPTHTAEPAWHVESTPVIADAEPDAWREVPVDSHQEQREVPIQTAPVAPAPLSEEEAETLRPAQPRADNVMRVAVGLGAAACVLLAAVLYEGGHFLPSSRPLRAASASSTATHASASAHLSPAASTTAVATVPPATVLFAFNNGATGGTVFRIRPGTAVAGLTRLVFDIHGSGLPTIVVTRPDDLHLTLIFKDTTATGVPVNGIRSYHVSAVEPGVQQGADGSITIDLARPVKVNAFTLPATGSFAWRLVVDIRSV